MTGRFPRRLALALLVIGASALPASAQSLPPPPEKKPLPGDGTEMFRYLLHLADVDPISPSDVWHVNARNCGDVILVVVGDPRPLLGPRPLATWLFEITRGGGAVLFLNESYIEMEQFRRPGVSYSVHMSGQSVLAGPGGRSLHNRARSPFVEPFNPRRENRGDNDSIADLFDGLSNVATQTPSFFVSRRPGPEFSLTLARFPRHCEIEHTGQELPENAAFALGGEGPHPETHNDFRFVAMADLNVFSNRLMAEAEVDNFELARRTVYALVDPVTSHKPSGADRKRCIFIEHGQHRTDFKAAEYIFKDPIPLPPVPPIGQLQDKLVDTGNQIIDRLQTNDSLNRGLLGSEPEQQNRRLRSVIGAMMGLAAVLVTILLLLRIWSARQAQDVPNPPESVKPGGGDPKKPAGIFDRRQRELTRRDDVSEPVRAIVREMFAAAGAPDNAGPKLPSVEIVALVRRPESLRTALADLWKLAYGSPVRLTVRRWETLEPLFLRARRAFADGKWRFAT